MEKRRGRPPSRGEAARRVFYIRLTDAEYEAFEAAALGNCQSMTEFARTAINNAAAESGERRVFGRPVSAIQ